MTRINTFKGVTKGNFPTLTEEQERAFGVINKPIVDTVKILQGNVGEDNLNQETRDIELLNDTYVKVKLAKLKGKCKAVKLVWNKSKYYASEPVWEVISDAEVKVKVQFKQQADVIDPSKVSLTTIQYLDHAAAPQIAIVLTSTSTSMSTITKAAFVPTTDTGKITVRLEFRAE